MLFACGSYWRLLRILVAVHMCTSSQLLHIIRSWGLLVPYAVCEASVLLAAGLEGPPNLIAILQAQCRILFHIGATYLLDLAGLRFSVTGMPRTYSHQPCSVEWIGVAAATYRRTRPFSLPQPPPSGRNCCLLQARSSPTKHGCLKDVNQNPTLLQEAQPSKQCQYL